MFSYIREKVSQFLVWFIPNTTKRMLVLTGAATVTCSDGMELTRDQFIEELNHRLKLATKQDSMLFAIELGKLLWRDLHRRYKMSKMDIIVLSNAIYEECPVSLRYDSKENMIKDICDAISFSEAYA